MDEICLRMEGVHYWRGAEQILSGIDWEIRKGENWAVLGANGSGKTTLMRIATGYIGSSQGRVFLLEGWISEIILPKVRQRVGFVSSAIADHLLRWWTHTPGVEVVASGKEAVIGAFSRATSPERERAAHLLEQLGFPHLAQRPFGLMSSGERQICLIARAQSSARGLTILDEPCAGLDLAAREKTLLALQRACCAKDSHAHVLITHHPEEIVPSISHVLLLRRGQVVAKGEKQSVLTEENLSETYGLPLHIVTRNGRMWLIPEGWGEEGDAVTLPLTVVEGEMELRTPSPQVR